MSVLLTTGHSASVGLGRGRHPQNTRGVHRWWVAGSVRFKGQEWDSHLQLRQSHDSNQGIVTDGSLTVILSAREKPSSLLTGLSGSSCRLSLKPLPRAAFPSMWRSRRAPPPSSFAERLAPAHRHLLPEWTIMDFGNEINLEDECIHGPIKGS